MKMAANDSLIIDVMTPAPVVLDEDTTLDEALERLECYGFRHLPVVRQDQVVGILSDRDLRLSTGLFHSDVRLTDKDGAAIPGPRLVSEVMIPTPKTATPEDPTRLAAQLMVRAGIGALPVVDDQEKILGIVTETNILEAFVRVCQLTRSACDDLVRYHMHTEVPTVRPATTILEALDAMDEQRHLVVTEFGELKGIVSDRDLLLGLSRASIRDARAESAGELEVESVRVASVMSERVVTTDPGSTLGAAARILLGCRFSALPVLERGALAGLLTQRDILEYYGSRV